MSAIIEVLIGLVFVFSLLSILVTQINAVIGNLLNLRARHLRDGLDDLLTDPVLRAKVFAHPLIRLIPQIVLPDQKISPADAEKVASGELNKVSWVDPEAFVAALLNIIKVDADQELFGLLMNIINDMPPGAERRTLRRMINTLQTTGEGLGVLQHYIDNMENEVYKERLVDALDQIDEEIGQIGMDSSGLISVVAGLSKIKNPFFRTAMETVLATAKNIDEARTNLTKWFNDGMNRSSEAFTRHMQTISLVVGLIIALTVNIDTLQLARTFWEDPVLREGVSQIAQDTDLSALIDESQAAVDAATTDGTSTDGTSATDSTATETPAQDTPLQRAQESAEAAVATLKQINELRLPIGWTWENVSTEPDGPTQVQLTDHRNLWNYFPGNNPHWLSLVLAKIVGVIATTIAIAQGAPFWFNILKKLARS